MGKLPLMNVTESEKYYYIRILKNILYCQRKAKATDKESLYMHTKQQNS